MTAKTLGMSRCPKYVIWIFLAMLPAVPACFENWALHCEADELRVLIDDEPILAEEKEENARCLADLAKQVTLLEAKTLRDSEVKAFQQSLVKMIREANCQLRQISGSNTISRAWHHNDDPLANAEPIDADVSNYSLHTHLISLSAVGAMRDIRAFLTTLRDDPHMKHIERLSLRPDDQDIRKLQLDVELFLVGLEQERVQAFDHASDD